MAYFGPSGLSGASIHASLKAYIECFLSPPFPKMFPRGGGIWDQDPILMRDFRIVRKFELEWKQSQEQIRAAESGMQSGGNPSMGGTGGLEGAMNQYLEQLEEDGLY